MEENFNVFAPYRQKKPPRNGPITAVQPLTGGVLRVTMETGSVIDVPMKEHFEEPRFCPLREEAVWKDVCTDGCFVRWNRDGVETVELTWDELMGMTLGQRWS